MHMDSRKFVTPGKGDANLDTTDTQTDSTEAENDSVDKVCQFLICACFQNGSACLRIYKGSRDFSKVRKFNSS